MNRLYEALAKADSEEALGLCSILRCPAGLASRKALLQERLEIFLGRRFANRTGVGEYDYGKICSRVARILKAPTVGSEAEVELRIVEQFVERFDAASGSGEKRAFLEEMARYDQKHKTQLVQVFAVGGLVALLRSGGFDSYVASSVVLHSLAGLLGITLSFGAYMTLANSLALVTGPVGWLGLGVSAFGTLQKLNDMQFAPLIIWTHIVMSDRADARPMLEGPE